MSSLVDTSSLDSSASKKSGGALYMLHKSFDCAVSPLLRRRTAESDDFFTDRKLAVIPSSSITVRVPKSPLAMLLSGGRAIHMDGIVKVRQLKSSKSVNYVPQIGWKRNLLVLEEGQLRLTPDLEDLDESVGKVFSLPDLIDISYNKRGDKLISLRFWKVNDCTRNLDIVPSNMIEQNSVVLQLRTNDAEIWVEKLLFDLRNQAKLLNSCASMLEDQNQIAGAEILLRQVCDMLSLGCGEYHEFTCAAQQRLVDILNKMGKLEEAEEWKCRLEENKVSSSNLDMLFSETTSTTKRKSSGLEQMQQFVELSCKAKLTDDMVARAAEFQRREEQLLEMMSSERSNLSRKAADAENRAILAEQEIQELRKTKPAIHSTKQGEMVATKLKIYERSQKFDSTKSKGACYLVHSSEGSLSFHWSHTNMPNAFAHFHPRISVPNFKFKQNAGGTEMIRSCQNGTSGTRNFFDAIIRFVKMGIENKCIEITVCKKSPFPFSIFLFGNKNSVSLAKEVFWVKGVQGIAVVKKDAAVFDGVATLPKERFLLLGNQAGVSLDLGQLNLAKKQTRILWLKTKRSKHLR